MDQAIKTNINKQAFLYGVIVGVIYIVLLTVENMFVSNMFGFYAIKIVGFLLYLTAIGLFAGQIRKSLGGYIDFKTVFGAIFIMILVSEVFYFVYNYIYLLYIDPNFMEKIKESTLGWMEKNKVPQESLDTTSAKFDQQIEEAKHFSIGKNLLNFFSFVVLDSLFGLIVAAIVKKNKPVNMA